MKFSSRWIGVIVSVAVVGLMLATPIFVSSSQGQEAPTTRPAARGRGRGPSLGGDMRAMGQAFGKIQAQYQDPAQNESTLTYLATFEAQVVTAKSALPPTITRMPEADRKKATDEYRLMLRNLLRA